jgi:hypothetical protein
MWIEFKGFADNELVEEFLSRDFIVKDATFDVRVEYVDMHPGGEVMRTGNYTSRKETRRVAIPKETPDLEITEQNYGDYLIEGVFSQLAFKRLIAMLTT